MKINYIIRHNNVVKLALAVFQLSLVVAFTSCSDDDNNSDSTSQIATENMELTRLNSMVDINIPGDADWQVTANPFWALPMDEKGTAGSKLELFVETNEDEADRTDTVTVATSDGKTYRYVLTQMGTLRDPDNGEALDAYQSPTNGVGYSLNILDNTYANLLKYNVKSTSIVNFGKLVKWLKANNEEEAFYYEDRHYSYTENVTGKSTEEIATQLAVNGKITLGLDAFNATVNGAYSSSSSDKSEYSYAMQEIKHIVGARYIRSGLLHSLAKQDVDIWQTSMKKQLEILKVATDSATIRKAIEKIVNTYGTHIITYAAIGGELRVAMKMKHTERTSDLDIHGALDLASKIVNSEGNNAKYSTEESNIADNTSISLKAYGGNASKFFVSPGSTFKSFQESIKNNQKAWADGIESKPALIEIEAVPLWDIMPTEASRTAMRNYIMKDLQRKKFNDDNYSSALYKIQNYFDKDAETEQWGIISLPRINREVHIVRKIVDELSGNDDELCTLIFSGTSGKVDYGCGFFVGTDRGSKSQRPAKVRFDDDANVTSIEPLDINGPVTEVYIDATGDLTLMPKSFSDLYNAVWVTEWKDFESDEEDEED